MPFLPGGAGLFLPWPPPTKGGAGQGLTAEQFAENCRELGLPRFSHAYLLNEQQGNTALVFPRVAANNLVLTSHTWAPGQDGIQFNSSSAYGSAASPVAADGFTTAFSVTAVVIPTSSTQRGTIIQKFNTTGNQRSWMLEAYGTGNNSVQMLISADGATSHGDAYYGVLVQNAINVITASWLPSVKTKTYVNGLEPAYSETAGNPQSSIYASTAPLDMGRSTYSTGRYFPGTILFVGIHNGAALTLAQHQTLVARWRDLYAARPARFFCDLSRLTGSADSAWQDLTRQTRDTAAAIATQISRASAWGVLSRQAGDAAWRLLAASSRDAAWRDLAVSNREATWGVLAGSSRDAAWQDLTGASRDASWKDLTASNRDTAWKGLAALSRDTTWKALAASNRNAAWDVLAASGLETAWQDLVASIRDTAWDLLTASMRGTGWADLAGQARQAAWDVLGRLSQEAAWQVLTQGSGLQEAAWQVLTRSLLDSDWRVLAGSSRDAAWKDLTAASRAAAWQDLAAAISDAAWDVLDAAQDTLAWRIARGASEASAWAVFTRLSQDAAWQILSEGAALQALAWQVLTRSLLGSSWDLLAGASAPVAWDDLTAAEQAVALRILAGSARLTAWQVTSPEEKFIRTFAIKISGGLSPSHLALLAKRDVVLIPRFAWDDLNGDTAAAIHALNPSAKVVSYLTATEVYSTHDSYGVEALNDLGRYNVSRGHSMGSLNGNHPELFVLTAGGERIYTAGYPDCLRLDFGDPAFRDYAIEVVETDVLGQPWEMDGVFSDNLGAIGGGLSATVAKYPTAAQWVPAMNGWIEALTEALEAQGKVLVANRGFTQEAAGAQAWLDLDAAASPPYAVLEEGAFAVTWGSGAVQFFSAAGWKSQLDVLAALQHSRALFLSHTDLHPGESGVDNVGQAVTYWDAFYFALGSFLLGKRATSLFQFSTQADYSIVDWADEFDRIDLGAALGAYEEITAGAATVYRRAFEDGYVYVNPGMAAASNLSLPYGCRQLSHDAINTDWSELPTISQISIAPHRAAILVRADYTQVNVGSRTATWTIATVDDQEISWRILEALGSAGTAWQIVNAETQQAAWRILGESLPEPLRIFLADARVCVYNAKARALVFLAKTH